MHSTEGALFILFWYRSKQVSASKCYISPALSSRRVAAENSCKQPSRCSIEQWKKGPLVDKGIKGIILHSYMGIVINHHNEDPYQTTSIMESKAGFFLGSICFVFK